MKRIFVTIVSIICTVSVWGQTDPLYTQYRANMMSVNPAYAGSREALTIGMLYRNQWVNLDGAPTTGTITVHSPIGKSLGFGLSVTNDAIGPTSQTGVFGNFSGRVKLGTTTYLAGGVQLGMDYFSTNFSGITTGRPDAAFSQDVIAVLPNVGAGIYLYSDSYYLGFSVPKIINSVLFEQAASTESVRQQRHYTLIAGYIFKISPNLKFKPTVLARLVQGAPLSSDITGEFVIADRFWLGGFYRLGESTGAIIGFNFTPQLKFGYSYDYTLTELVNFSTGSHELTLTYDFIYKGGRKIRSPRYF